MKQIVIHMIGLWKDQKSWIEKKIKMYDSYNILKEIKKKLNIRDFNDLKTKFIIIKINLKVTMKH